MLTTESIASSVHSLRISREWTEICQAGRVPGSKFSVLEQQSCPINLL